MRRQDAGETERKRRKEEGIEGRKEGEKESGPRMLSTPIDTREDACDAAPITYADWKSSERKERKKRGRASLAHCCCFNRSESESKRREERE